MHCLLRLQLDFIGLKTELLTQKNNYVSKGERVLARR